MKRLNILIITLLMVVSAFAQQNSDGKVSFFSVVNNQSNSMPQAAVSALESKMQQMVTVDGYGSAARCDRFVIVAKPSVVTKDVTPTTPTRISQTVEITFVIGDVVENKTYASCALTFSGIGVNETKAWISVLGKLKPTNEEIKKMLSDAAGKIETYYSANCRTIISKADTDAAQGNYDKAIASLIEIPDICSECFSYAQNKAVEIYQRKIDTEAISLLSKAKAEWVAAPNSVGANKAMQFLKQIKPQTSSYAEKEKLEQNIIEKLSEDERRRWVQEIRRYNDELKLRQKEQQNSHQRQMARISADREERRNSHSREMAQIAACRSIAEKWAENQPRTNVYLNW